MNPNIKPNEVAVLAGVIDPDSYAAGTYTSGWISLADYEAIQAIVAVGDMGTLATVDAKLEQASDGSGSGAKDITGKAITQLTQAGTDNDKQAIITCYADDLDVENSFTHVRLSITVGTAACDVAGVILGHNARYAPAEALSTVDEIVG